MYIQYLGMASFSYSCSKNLNILFKFSSNSDSVNQFIWIQFKYLDDLTASSRGNVLFFFHVWQRSELTVPNDLHLLPHSILPSLYFRCRIFSLRVKRVYEGMDGKRSSFAIIHSN